MMSCYCIFVAVMWLLFQMTICETEINEGNTQSRSLRDWEITNPFIDVEKDWCPSRTTKRSSVEYPATNRLCYNNEATNKTSHERKCNQYLECHPNQCRWLVKTCEKGEFWNHAFRRCLNGPERADCGSYAKVQILNIKYNKALHDGFAYNPVIDWSRTSAVIGFDKQTIPKWDQILLSDRRLGEEYISFAFDQRDEDYFKVITVDGEGNVMSMVFHPNEYRHNWKLLPIPDEENGYRIISIFNRKSLEMFEDNEDTTIKYKVKVSDPDPINMAQHWKFNYINE